MNSQENDLQEKNQAPQHKGDEKHDESQREKYAASQYKGDESIGIIGGGASGLSAAYFLLEAGHTGPITIYEKSHRFGGHARTIYVHIISENEKRIISEYDMEIDENNDPILLYKNHENENVKLSATLPNVVPVDCIVTTTGGEQYFNFHAMLNKLNKAEVNTILTTGITSKYSSGNHSVSSKDKESYNPFTMYKLYNIKKVHDQVISNQAKEYIQNHPEATFGELLMQLGISFDDPSLIVLISITRCLLSYTQEQALSMKASNAYVGFKQIVINRKSACLRDGMGVYLKQLRKYLESNNVELKLKTEYQPEENYHDHIIYSCQPWNLPQHLKELPEISPYSNNKASGQILLTNEFLEKDNDHAFRFSIQEDKQYFVMDIDLIRQHKQDTGLFLSVHTPQKEGISAKEQEEHRNSKQLIHVDKSHNVNFCKIWGLEYTAVHGTSPTKGKIWSIQGQKSDNGSHIWYSNGAYSYLLHEAAWTMSLDVVCLITGKRDMLREKGYWPTAGNPMSSKEVEDESSIFDYMNLLIGIGVVVVLAYAYYTFM